MRCRLASYDEAEGSGAARSPLTRMAPSADAMRSSPSPGDPACSAPTRHDRVWLAPATWRDGLASDLDDAVDKEVDDWIRRGRALVARRRDAEVDKDACCLGIALPLARGRRRIAVVVRRAAVIRVCAPLALAAIVDPAPLRWRPALRDLQQRAVALDTPLAVYGSFAWQAISGEPCVTAASDLDLLWDARDFDHVGRVIAMLLAWQDDSGLRADGEARFANGDAVAWRELATPASRVLVKNDDGVALKPPAMLR